MTHPSVGVARPGDPVALITGASAGIGAGCAQVFHAAGYRVAGCSNDPAAGEALFARLNGERDASAWFVEADMRQPADISRTVAAAVDEFGRIDVVINNVGGSQPDKTVDELDLAEIDDVIRLNLMSCILTTREALPHLRASKGAIVNIGSVAGLVGHERIAIYSASKGAIVSFTKSVAIDEIRHGVRVNAVLPGNVMTASRQRIEDALDDATEMHDYIESWQWIGRSGQASEIAEVCLFLASDKASFITGTEVVASGGSEIGSGPKLRVQIGTDGRVMASPRASSNDIHASSNDTEVEDDR